MKILLLSDSHAALRFMMDCVEAVKPDVLIHLGDYADDGAALHESYPHIPLYQVPGNCDRYRWDSREPEILVPTIGGVRLYLAHGHQHHVKQFLGDLTRAARGSGAQAALYGHTHQADCHREEDGLWVINPGSCGFYGGTAGLMEIREGKIQDCRILTHQDCRFVNDVLHIRESKKNVFG